MPRHHLIIRGRVQGVFFRASIIELARPAGITGWVRNRADGSVEAIAEGSAAALERLRAYCAQGPPGAFVRDVQVIEGTETGEFAEFNYRADS